MVALQIDGAGRRRVRPNGARGRPPVGPVAEEAGDGHGRIGQQRVDERRVQRLQIEHRAQLPADVEPRALRLRFEAARAEVAAAEEDEGDLSPSRALLKALFKVCGWQFLSVGCLKFAADLFGFANPFLLGRFLAFIEDRSEEMKWGYIYAGGMLGCSLLASLCTIHFDFLINEVGLKVRAAVVTAVYGQTVSVSSTGMSR